MTLFWRKKVLLAKIETTYGVDPTPTGAANAILATEVELMPMEGEAESRNLDRLAMGGQPFVVTQLHRKLKFKVELVGSGTAGTAPGWGPLLRACGCAQVVNAGTNVIYNPISAAFESVTIYLNVDGMQFALLGARGTAKIMLDAQKIPHLEFEFTGLFVQPTDTAMPTPTLTAFQAPVHAATVNTPVFTIGAYSPILKDFSFDLGNQIAKRFWIGSESILISDRAEKVDFTIETKALATFNPFALAAAGTTQALTLQHGTVAGRRSTLAIPSLQIDRPTGMGQTDGIAEWPLSGVPIPGAAGNDQFTLTLT